jgi:cell division septation protein DedD
MRWLELAREDVADALDAAGSLAPDVEADVRAVAARDVAMAGEVGDPADAPVADDPVDALYAARDLVTDALERAGPTRDGVRRVLRLAIADDLRLADRLRGGGG